VREGATVEEAAGRADIAAAELQDYLDRANRLSGQFARFGAPPAPAPGKPETSGITLLVDASRAGHFVDIDPETYRLYWRTELKIHTANCEDSEMRAAALKLMDEFDRRFDLS
jgi:hypothetical protein